jgi:phosphoglycolate phosphatase-like HAD superfamily hydrolase
MNSQNLDILLARFRLRSLFQHVVSTGDISEPQKQKRTGYHLGKLLREEGLKPDEALVVGDAVVDVQMARQQHVPLIVVLTGHLDRQQARELGVETVLPSIADLPEWLESAAIGS